MVGRLSSGHGFDGLAGMAAGAAFGLGGTAAGPGAAMCAGCAIGAAGTGTDTVKVLQHRGL